MSNDEARFLLEEMEFLLATNSPIGRRERTLRIKDWISRQPMEGAAGSERDRGDKRIMEYRIFSQFYPTEAETILNRLARDGWVLRGFQMVAQSILLVMERERAEGT